MKKRIWQPICLTLLFLLVQFLPLLAQSQLRCYFDVKQYRFNADTSLVEVYYGVLPAVDTQGPYVLEFSITANKKQFVKNIWQIQATADTNNQNKQQQMIVDILRYLLCPGEYQFKLFAKDLARPDAVDSCEMNNFIVTIIDPQKAGISDIELAQKISPSEPSKSTSFDKNRFYVFPNVIGIYDSENPDVYYYAEIYNLTQSFPDQFYYIKRMLVNGLGLPEPSVPIYTKKKRVRGDDVEVGMFNSAKLQSGKYFLKLALTDQDDHEIAFSTTSFYVHNPEVVEVNQAALSFDSQVAASEVALLSSENLDLFLNATKLLITEQEKKIVDNLITKEAKQAYLYRFWKERDQNPATLSLESFREFMQRVQYANTNFGQMKKQGWETDRGRVLICFGKPAEIQYYANVPDFKEFQAWSYDQIENGVVFIFGVVGSFGDLSLIHSTKTGEIQNEAWIDLLKVSEGRLMLGDATGTSESESVRDIFRRYNLEWPRYLK